MSIRKKRQKKSATPDAVLLQFSMKGIAEGEDEFVVL